MDLEQVSAQIDALIERRAGKSPDPDELEPGYMESVRRFHARRREENRWQWVRFFDRMAASHAALAASYEKRAEALLEEPQGSGGDG